VGALLRGPGQQAHIHSPEIPKREAQLAVPYIEFHLRVGPDYPGADYYPNKARELRLEGDCTVHALIANDGSPSEISVTKSTGSASLDQACVLAIQQALILPRLEKGIAVDGSIDISTSWRLSH
jgi:TonB family protein